jgi:rRNA maturation protein Nop10
MRTKKCHKKGGTLKEACRAVFKSGGGWFVEECKVCGKYHIIGEPKTV